MLVAASVMLATAWCVTPRVRVEFSDAAVAASDLIPRGAASRPPVGYDPHRATHMVAQFGTVDR